MRQRINPARTWLRGVALAAALGAGTAAALPAQVRALGIDTAGMDRSVRPQDDFYQFANGNWLRNTQIPPDRSSYGPFTMLADGSAAAVRQILEEAAAVRNPAPGSDMQKLGDLYASFMDSARVEAAGATPVRADLARINAVSSREQLPVLFATSARLGVSSPFSVSVEQDGKQSDRYIVYARQGGLGMPDRDYYLAQDPRMQAARTAYVTYITTLLQLAGQPDPAGSAQRVLALETELAKRQWDRVRSDDRTATYNKMAVADLQRLTPHFEWARYFATTGMNTAEVVVAQPSYFAGADSVLAAARLADVKAYAAVRLLDSAAPYLSSPFVNARFEFRGRALQGQRAQSPRSRRGTAIVDDGLGMMLGKVYVERHFPAEHKQAMQRLVANLLAAFGERIDSLSWMSPETKAQAHEKLRNVTVKIGYPDSWQDYSALQVSRGDLFGNMRNVRAYQHNRMVSRLGRPVDRTEWAMTPQTVNAYYWSRNNEIGFPAAVLQPPFFDPNADDAVNYGGIVATIGHELSHGFDDQGRKVDGAGNIRDWWTPADAAAFQQRAEMLVEQYSAYSPLDGLKVNGRLTLGENIADLSGLAVAYRAYRNSLNGREAPVIAGFTGDQRFFMGWAQVWRALFRDEALRQRLLTDSHSPGMYRANGTLVNNEAFYRAFGVKEGDRMYRPADQRVVIW